MQPSSSRSTKLVHSSAEAGCLSAALQGQKRYFVKRTLRTIWKPGSAKRRRAQRDESRRLGAGQSIVRLHRERWRAEGVTRVRGEPSFSASTRKMMKAFPTATTAELELCWLEHRAAPSPCSTASSTGARHFYQSGRSLDVPKTVRPGIGAHLSPSSAHRSRPPSVRLLEGEQMYKSQLSSEERGSHLRALSPRCARARWKRHAKRCSSREAVPRDLRAAPRQRGAR